MIRIIADSKEKLLSIERTLADSDYCPFMSKLSTCHVEEPCINCHEKVSYQLVKETAVNKETVINLIYIEAYMSPYYQCPICGNTVETPAKYCDNCGQRVKKPEDKIDGC